VPAAVCNELLGCNAVIEVTVEGMMQSSNPVENAISH
jgi:hypothetical protein